MTVLVAGAASAATRAEVEQLLSTLTPVPADPLPFVERRMSRLFAQPLELRGEIRVDANGQIDKRITAPFAERLRIDATEVVIERDGQRRRFALGTDARWRAFHSGLSGLLRRDAAALLAVFDARIAGTGAGWTLTLQPRSTRRRSPVRAIIATAVDGRITTVRIEQADDEWQELQFVVPPR
jgi:hypothetical protein